MDYYQSEKLCKNQTFRDLQFIYASLTQKVPYNTDKKRIVNNLLESYEVCSDLEDRRKTLQAMYSLKSPQVLSPIIEIIKKEKDEDQKTLAFNVIYTINNEKATDFLISSFIIEKNERLKLNIIEAISTRYLTDKNLEKLWDIYKSKRISVKESETKFLVKTFTNAKNRHKDRIKTYSNWLNKNQPTILENKCWPLGNKNKYIEDIKNCNID